MFARILVTGLILDPEISLRSSLFSPTGLVPTVSHKIFKQSTLHRTTSKVVPRGKSSWRFTPPPSTATPLGDRKQTSVLETPFQHAMAKQHSLSTQGRPYLRHSWHRIDMIAVVAFWITFFLALTGYESTAQRHVYLFRALSVLRAGRLLVITSGTTTILHSLKRAGPLLITVASFLIFAFALFSIIGVQSFRGSFRRQCVLTDQFNTSNTIALSQPCGGFLSDTFDHLPYLQQDGSRSLIGAKGYICPRNQVCQVRLGPQGR